MRTKISSARLFVLAAFAIVFTGSAIFLFTDSPAAQKISDDEISPTEEAFPEAGTIQGTVYIDFNMNGVRNTTGVAPNLAVDDGIGGVTVTAYAANGASVTTTSAANGTYSLNTTSLPAGPYRIEFTNLPTGYYPSYIGTNNASTVRIVPDGSQAGVDLGILNAAEEYCQNTPDVVTPRWQNGDTTGNLTPSLTTVPWGTLSRTPSANTNVSTLDEIGTTWATAFKRDTRRLFTPAFLRRHSGFGSQGIGGVYILDFAVAGVPLAGSFTLQGVTPTNGGAAINLGTVNRTLVPGDIAAGAAGDNQLGDPIYANRDLDAFDKVGKASFGDAEFEANMRYLWLVNLNQRALIRVDTSVPVASMAATARQYLVASGASTATTMGGAPTCTNGVFRPFAIKFYRGRGYLGGTCTAENAGGTAANLSAVILSFDPVNPTLGLTTETTVPLNFTREARETGAPQFEATWMPWRSTWATVITSPDSNSNAAPLLANIEFSQNGSMVLGMMDRVSAQVGNNNYIAVSGSPTLYDKKSAGDISMICRVANTWVREGGATCPVQDNSPFTFTAASDAQIMSDVDGLTNVGEFFWGDAYFFANGDGGHGEVALGGLLTYPGVDQVVTTTFDPVIPISGSGNDVFNTQGLTYFSTLDGSRIGYPGTSKFAATNGAGYLMVTATNNPEDLGKALGLGEPDLLCNAAPLQIGNRIWRDTDLDGVQDPNEAPIAGVTVNLYLNGVLVGTTTTDANGNHVFSGVQPNTAYEIRFDNPVNYQTGGALSGLSPTTPNQTSQPGNDDGSDSDTILITNPQGSPVGSYPVIFVTTGGAGQNDHTLDGGFVPTLIPTAGDATVTGRVLTANGFPIRNAIVILTEADGTVHRSVTGSFGYFTFEGVAAGQSVLIDVSAGKRSFTVPTMVVSVDDNVTGVTFYANELR